MRGEISCPVLSRQFKERRAKVLFFPKAIEKCTENFNIPADQQILTSISFWSCDQHTKRKKKRKENSFVHIFLIVLVLYSWNRFWVRDKNYQTLLITLKYSYVLNPSHACPWCHCHWGREEPGTQSWNTAHRNGLLSYQVLSHISLSLKAITSDRILSKFIKLHFTKKNLV